MFKNYRSLEKLSGIVTWATVAGMSIFVLLKNEYPIAHISLAVFLYLLYITTWLAMTRVEKYSNDTYLRTSFLGLLFVIVIGIYFTVPLTFNAILMGIAGAALPYFFTVRLSLLISSLTIIPLYLIYRIYWNADAIFLSSALFWTFNMFAVIMVNSTVTAHRAKEKLEAINLELTSTQSLLEEASKQNERTRIARNIHDLLGHHLTALSINLQVASLKTEGEVKQNIDQCYQLAKLLLSDVREAVSDMRDKSHIDLEAAVKSMSEKVPDLSIEVDFKDAPKIENIQVADTLLKCIQESVTNTIKHSKTPTISFSLSQDKTNICLNIKSYGEMPANLKPGNGINGMKERIALLNGKIEFQLEKEMLITDINIPSDQEGL